MRGRQRLELDTLGQRPGLAQNHPDLSKPTAPSLLCAVQSSQRPPHLLPVCPWSCLNCLNQEAVLTMMRLSAFFRGESGGELGPPVEMWQTPGTAQQVLWEWDSSARWGPELGPGTRGACRCLL